MNIAVPLVSRTPGSADFFDSAKQGKLLIRRCNTCGATRGPQEPACPHCHSFAHTLDHAEGSATLVSWAVVHRSPLPALEAETPYVAGIIEITEGPWLLVRVLTAPNETLHAGAKLEVWVAPATSDDGEPLVLARTSARADAG